MAEQTSPLERGLTLVTRLLSIAASAIVLWEFKKRIDDSKDPAEKAAEESNKTP